METKKLSEILDSFSKNNTSGKKERFNKVLEECMIKKYGSVNIKQFTDDCVRIIGEAQDEELNRGSISKRISRDLKDYENDVIKNANGATFNISRLNIIQYGFVLAENMEQDRLELVNKLLQSTGYPMLRASNIEELFLIYAFKNRISYKECSKLYDRYNFFVENKGEENISKGTTEKENNYSLKTSTYFHINLVEQHFSSEEDFFTEVFVASQNMYESSLKVKQIYCTSLKKLQQKNNMGKIDVYADFILTFSKTNKNKKDIWEEIVMVKNFSGSKKDFLISHFDELEDENYIEFIPIRQVEKSAPNKVQTIISALENITSDENKVNKYILSRELYLLWLLYCGYSLKEINAEIGRRYAELDKNSYFDLFVLIAGSISYEEQNGKKLVVFTDVLDNNKKYIVEDDKRKLDITDENACKKSFINLLIEIFDTNFAATQIISNSTSTIKSILK